MKITAFRKDVPDKLQLPHAIAWFPIVRKKAKLDLRVHVVVVGTLLWSPVQHVDERLDKLGGRGM